MTEKNIYSDISEQDFKLYQKFADRTRESSMELHRLLVSLSTGILIFLMIAVTSEIKPPLSLQQKTFVIFSLVFYTTAILIGIFTWFADIRRHHFGSRIHLIKSKEEKEGMRMKGIKWCKMRDWSFAAIAVFFLSGIICSIVYILLRL